MRSVARCKRCGTEFPLVGEISGCPNCHHDELDCFPKDEVEELIDDIPQDELIAFAKDLTKADEDAFMTELMEHNNSTKRFLEELEREFEMDQAIRELMEEGIDENEAAEKVKKEYWSKQPHHSHCCCDKCAPTKEDVKRRAADFEVKQRKISRAGHCRTCQRWKKLVPQYGACNLKAEPMNVTMWCDACPSYWNNSNYAAEQVEIREKRKAHDSILRAMERSRS